jgi:hypothetical protein
MRKLLFLLACGTTALSGQPGTLVKGAEGRLNQLLRAADPRLPAGAMETRLLVCEFQGEAAGQPVNRYYWLGKTPAWLRALPAAHPLQKVEKAARTECPARLQAKVPEKAPVTPVTIPATIPAAIPAAVPAAAAEPIHLDFAGVQYTSQLQSLFRGEFHKVGMDRDGVIVEGLFANYLNAYAAACAEYLPRNKVMMTREECIRERYTVNGYGVQVGAATCIEYRTVETGLYADPVMYEALRTIRVRAAMNMGREVLKGIADPGAMIGKAGNAVQLNADLKTLLSRNACGGEGVRRFGENLLRFGTGRPGLKLGEDARTAAAKPYLEPDMARLMEALVSVNARGWAFNRYLGGSTRGVRVTERDEAGRPLKVSAEYEFSGFSGRAAGSLTVEFADGLPLCLYFHDFPGNCRAPDPGVVAELEAGRFAK